MNEQIHTWGKTTIISFENLNRNDDKYIYATEKINK